MSRGIRLVRDAMNDEPGLPLIGQVAAGRPILAEENILARPQVDPAVFKPRADYLLEVRGNSMCQVGILEGDWLAVHKQAQAHNGQIVVARIGDEVTVKRLRMNGPYAELHAENPDFASIRVNLKREAFAIEGIAVGVLRASF
jgi:repressor LexA